jgi:hypothetical protein
MRKWIRVAIAFLVCTVALLLPYRARVFYFYLISELVHLPFRLFGRLAKQILKQTQTPNPFEASPSP